MNKKFYWSIPEEIRFSWARVPFDMITAQNREFTAELDNPDFDRSTRMDATRNNATMYLQDATEFICIYPQGLFPMKLADEMVASSRELLERLSKDYPPVILKPLEHAYSRYFCYWYGSNIQRVPEELYAKRLFEAMNNMLKAIDNFNIYVATNPPQAKPSATKRGRGRPAKNDQPVKERGPKNTRMMKVERKEVITYLEIDCHRTIDSCTPADCLHVWNRPENKPSFDYAAKQHDATRGYSDYNALYAAIVYYREQEILRSQRKKAGLPTK